ncbi:MAG: amino acid racemase [Bacteroidales bacterium]|nr:amino acid racemase [Bacteroidales bacterium]
MINNIFSVFQQALFNELVYKKLGGQNSAKILLYSFNFDDLRVWQTTNTILLAKNLAQEAKNLEKAGADIILIGANTMHEYYPQVRNVLTVPVLHIAKAVGNEIIKQGIKRVLLLGTIYTMQGDFYKEKLKEYGIITVVPDLEDQEIINNVIYNELTFGLINDSSRAAYLKIIDKYKLQNQIEGIILGCTEIPLLIKQEHTGLKVFDTTLIHAKAAVDFVIG